MYRLIPNQALNVSVAAAPEVAVRARRCASLYALDQLAPGLLAAAGLQRDHAGPLQELHHLAGPNWCAAPLACWRPRSCHTTAPRSCWH